MQRKFNLGKNRKCKLCGKSPVLHVNFFPLGGTSYALVGLTCRCRRRRIRVHLSMASARKYWNKVN